MADATDYILGRDAAERLDPGAKAERRATIADRAADLREAEGPALAAALRSAQAAVKDAAVRDYIPRL